MQPIPYSSSVTAARASWTLSRYADRNWHSSMCRQDEFKHDLDSTFPSRSFSVIVIIRQEQTLGLRNATICRLIPDCRYSTFIPLLKLPSCWPTCRDGN
eukprot:scaffold331861_cov27-Prasinocladus_malaysianus.AAC.1